MRIQSPALLPVALLLAASLTGAQQKLAPAAPGQARPGKPASEPKDEFGFRCPDPQASDACKSYSELRKAGDESVAKNFADGIGYVCFRPDVDEFFILELTIPYFPTHLDPQTRKIVPDKGATSEAVGEIRSFAQGIQDGSIMPIWRFSGKWTYRFGAVFSATEINDQNEISDAEHYGVTADSSQITASFRYKNRLEKNIDYSLVIQRSTGRFSESYVEPPARFPFSQRNGRCSRLQATEPKPTR